MGALPCRARRHLGCVMSVQVCANPLAFAVPPFFCRLSPGCRGRAGDVLHEGGASPRPGHAAVLQREETGGCWLGRQHGISVTGWLAGWPDGCGPLAACWAGHRLEAEAVGRVGAVPKCAPLALAASSQLS